VSGGLPSIESRTSPTFTWPWSAKALVNNGLESGTGSGGDEPRKAPVHTSASVRSPANWPAVRFTWRMVPSGWRGQVAHRGEITEFSVPLQRRFEFKPDPAQRLVLHLQLDLVDRMFVDEPRGNFSAVPGSPAPDL